MKHTGHNDVSCMRCEENTFSIPTSNIQEQMNITCTDKTALLIISCFTRKYAAQMAHIICNPLCNLKIAFCNTAARCIVLSLVCLSEASLIFHIWVECHTIITYTSIYNALSALAEKQCLIVFNDHDNKEFTVMTQSCKHYDSDDSINITVQHLINAQNTSLYQECRLSVGSDVAAVQSCPK